jgi:NAD(P)-dependent dehydrogenase (short-subunit alcohol dehydrogenase family)
VTEPRAGGQHIPVTAGASGIGRDALVGAGALFHLCDIHEAALAAVRQTQPDIGMTIADVADEQVDRLGGLDVLVNSGGIAGPTAPVDEIDLADWQRYIDVDLTGRFLCVRRAVPLLKAAGGGEMGRDQSAREPRQEDRAIEQLGQRHLACPVEGRASRARSAHAPRPPVCPTKK